jgi:mycobactin salicyl-AMP ligase
METTLTATGADDLLDGFAPHTPDDADAYRRAGVFRDQPLWQLLADTAATRPDAPAITDAATSTTLSYRDFHDAVQRRATGFVMSGLSTGQRVVLQQNNSAEFAITFFGLLRAGVVPVMALPAHRIAEIAHLAETSGAVGYLTDDDRHGFDYRTLAAELVDRVPTVTGVYINGAPGRFQPMPDAEPNLDLLPAVGDPDAPALMLVSGGTTGLPKLIARTHNDYDYNARRSAEVAELTADDAVLVVLPAAHNFPLCCPGLLGTVFVGGHAVFTSNPAPDNTFDLIEVDGITTTALVPALAQMWGAAAEWEPADTSSLRLLQVGGAKLAHADAITLETAFPGAVQQVFGMAEGLICYTRLDDERTTVHSTQGRPMSDLDDVRIVDERGNDVADGVDGELLVKGPYTIRGYYRAGERGAASFTPDGYYRSGDQVRRLPGGHLVVTGRIKDTIVRAGENVAADDIEDRLLTHPAVFQAAIVGLPDPTLGESICAVVVLASGATAPSLADMRAFLTDAGLAAFKLPDRLAVLPSLPVTAVGKIDKRALVAQL